MKKGLKRTLIYSAIVGGFLVGAFVCYGLSRDYRSQYKDVSQQIAKIDASTSMTDAEKEAARAPMVEKRNGIDNTHKALAGTAYTLTIGSLAAFGICLAVSDKIKAKEEAIAEGRAK